MHELEILDNPRERVVSVGNLDSTDNISFSLFKGPKSRLTGPILLLLLAVALLVSCSHWKPRGFPAGLSIHRSKLGETEVHKNLAESSSSITGNGFVQLSNATDERGVRPFVT
jgi:hypothetical protein